MRRKLLVSRLGAGSITIAFCAALPGCNLAVYPSGCVGQPSSRGMSSVECPAPGDDSRADTSGDATSDSASTTADAPPGDATGDRS
jgi:hypothetical protein